ncbi:MAG: hypothetical protein HY657_00525, partial [Acidobacteria bacterium]|nr:hypothetical protein [Acidobacteriota bacterium]
VRGKRPRRRQQPASEELEAYAELTGAKPSSKGRLVKGGLVGLTALGLTGWIWNRYKTKSGTQSKEEERGSAPNRQLD